MNKERFVGRKAARDLTVEEINAISGGDDETWGGDDEIVHSHDDETWGGDDEIVHSHDDEIHHPITGTAG